MKKPLIVMAAAETATGLGLLALPSLCARLILGAELETAVAITLARVAGVALLTLGVACWRARDDTDSRATTGLVSAMSLYNAGVCAVLLYAAWVAKLSAVGLWPVAVAHAGLAAWCLASLAPRRLTG